MVASFIKHILLIIVYLFVYTLGSPIEIDQETWIPDLRGVPLSRREGDIVAEFSVASSPSQTSQELDESNLEGDKIVRPNKEYNICTDPESKIILYPKNEGEKSLPLTTAVEQFGRFDDIEDGDLGSNPGSKIEFKSVLITGKCCWEAFSRPLYNGKKLRMCRGKYTARDLGTLSSNIASIRPVNFVG